MRKRCHLPALTFVALASVQGCAPGGSAYPISDTGGTPDGGSIVIPKVVEGECQAQPDAGSPEFMKAVGCMADFQALASEPIDVTLPGARSGKVVLDQQGGDALYFQNSVKYQVHYEFVSTHLSGGDLPVVPTLSEFNTTEYFSPDRRFILGAVTYYEGPGIWALELSPYDTADAGMIEKLYAAVALKAFFGPALFFHPTSDALLKVASGLPPAVPVVTTNTIYAGIDYQPLTIATGVGQLVFRKAVDLETEYLSYKTLVVLDEAPNDISVVQGLITAEFQTPLSHVNVLSQNRHTPNMGLRGALDNTVLRALEGKLVELTVGSTGWSVREVTSEEAEAFWLEHMPDAVTLPGMNLDVRAMVDIREVTTEPGVGETLRGAILKAVNAFGGKAAQYSVLAQMDGIPIRDAFAVPVYYYDQFMRENGFYDRVASFMADEEFTTDYEVRDRKLAQMRADMMKAPIDAEFQELLKAAIAEKFPAATYGLRFRTSTNSEDLEGFPCAGCYESHSGDPNVWESLLDAIRETYASAWLFRSFEERTYYRVDHASVSMGLIVHRNFPDEEANGVAVTSNPFDASGLDPAFYVNVQYGGDVEVVHPTAGTSSDQFLYYYSQPNQPIAYISHSNLIPDGDTVLDSTQIHNLGAALAAIHEKFSAAYGPAAGNTGWYAMDVEFKLDDDGVQGRAPALWIKQARPYPGRGK
ncbi:MAG: PEP/pyruvate-binding domain-containing protein [Myxococcota bacterium]|jgi:hypothetical protein